VKSYAVQSVMFFILVLVCTVAGSAAEREPRPVLNSTAGQRSSISLVVYSDNLALVREVRSVPRRKGLFELRFKDVAEKLLPSSVLVDTGAEVEILEQRYTYDLLSVTSLLERYIGRTVILERLDKRTNTTLQVEGTLLSLDGGRIVKIGDRVEIDPEGRFILPEVPGDLTRRPALAWLMRSKSAGRSRVEVSYLTGGVSWSCDYVLSLTEEQAAGLSGWVTLNNRSGVEYRKCELNLVAGETHRVQQAYPMAEMMAVRAAPVPEARGAARDEGFRRRDLSDYHRYTLGRPVSLGNKESKQLELFKRDIVKIGKHYRLRGSRNFFYNRVPVPSRDLKVAQYLEWVNGWDNYPGMPLPAGRVRVYRQEPQGAVFFLGEDRIGHTPRQEKVSITVGSAFDLTAERKQTEFSKLSDRLRRVSLEITLTNRKKEDVVIEVEETLPGDWTMLDHSHEYEKMDASRIRFSPVVKAGGKTVLKYSIKFI